MKRSCTILVSHYESVNFLHLCISQIRKYANESVSQHILIVDQSGELIHNNIVKQYWGSLDITVIKTKPLYSGFGIDYAMRFADIKTEYVAQIHVDAAPIHKNWLSLPIQLIEEYNLSFVGQLHFISDGTSSVYPPNNIFYSMSPTFNVAKTETYKEMSLEAGFTRFHYQPQSGLEFKNDDWAAWASEDYNARGSDDDTVAFHWEGKYRNTDKLGLAISGFIEPQYGRIIDDLVFHFGSGNEARLVMSQMPELYQYYTKKINEDYSDELIFEMIKLAKANKPPEAEILTCNFWNGTTKKRSPPSEELKKRIEELKSE